MPDLRDFSERIYWLARRIPAGRVATYGQLAFLAAHPGAARAAGRALKACVGARPPVPWHRVINARGTISLRGDYERARAQRSLLEAEGIEFDARGRLDLAAREWSPRLGELGAPWPIDDPA